MFTKWKELQEYQQELQDKLMSGNVQQKERSELQRNVSAATEILQKHGLISELKNQIFDAEEQMKAEADSELQEMFAQEIEELQSQVAFEEKELEDIMYPADNLTKRAAYLEIRAGAGGKEAALFAGDLLKMYLQYAAKRRWKTEITSESTTELGGYKEVIVHITGKNVYGDLKYESGVHRVQRVPETETSGRVHTSTATVAVLPEAKEVDVQVNDQDLKIDTYRASGAGGQHVNTTDSAIRITHLPTGLVVTCQDERSQHKNKASALKVLRSRLLAHAQEKRQKEESDARKEQVGSGDRSEKIRTYNYPQNRVTDHQVNLTLKKLDFVVMGELDEIIDALKNMDRKTRKMHPVLNRM